MKCFIVQPFFDVKQFRIELIGIDELGIQFTFGEMECSYARLHSKIDKKPEFRKHFMFSLFRINNPTTHNCSVISIDTFTIKPEYRNRGYGKQILWILHHFFKQISDVKFICTSAIPLELHNDEHVLDRTGAVTGVYALAKARMTRFLERCYFHERRGAGVYNLMLQSVPDESNEHAVFLEDLKNAKYKFECFGIIGYEWEEERIAYMNYAQIKKGQ
jgi:hypothetical protein